MTDLSQYSPILKTTGFGGKPSQHVVLTPSDYTLLEPPSKVISESETQDSTDKTKLEYGQLLGKRRAADTELSTVQPPKKTANFNSANLYFSFSAYHIHCMPISKRKRRKKRSLKNDWGDFVPVESPIKARRLLNAQKLSSKKDATSDS